MIKNWFKKNKQTGWEISELMDSLRKAYEGESNQLIKYSNNFSLAAISPDKRHFVVIRDFSFHVTDGKINMLNAQGQNSKSHKGMTIAHLIDDGASCKNVILPDSLEYKKVELGDSEIILHYNEDKTVTNFQEIHKLWTLHKLSEDEILGIFMSFTNEFVEKPKIKKQTAHTINSDDFGVLTLDEKINSYCSNIIYNKIELQFSFSNIEKTQFDKNLLTTKNALSRKENIQENMINEMLKLKNESWLEDGQKELDKNDFLKDIRLYGLNIYEEGDIEFYYRAGDLFWGHEIMTSVDSDGNYQDSTIVG